MSPKLEQYLPKLKQYLQNLGTAISQLFNAILAGDPDESFSGRNAKIAREYGKERPFSYCLCKLLHLLDPNHCEKSIEEDEGGRAIDFSSKSK